MGSPRRGASTKFRPFGDFDACYGGWEIDGEPYTQSRRYQMGLVARTNAGWPNQSLGKNFTCVLVPKILKEKVLMAWVRLANRL